MKQKFFFFDVDNTLMLWPTGEMPEDTRYCLEELQNNGHRVALATGRLQKDAVRFACRAGLTDYVADGGMSVTVDHEIIHMEGLPRDFCLAYLAQVDKAGIPWAVTYRNEISRVSPKEEVLPLVPSWDIFETVVDPHFDYRQVENFYKLYVYCTPEEAAAKGIDAMGMPFIHYGGTCLLFEPMEKARGIKRLADYYGIAYEDIVTFGDGINDLSMFEPQWFNIAMGNAKPELKAKADYVTAACDEGGILKACRHFGWVK